MNQRLKSVITLLAAACALAFATGAAAQSAGQFTAKIGVGKITPKVDSGAISAPALPNSLVDVGSDTRPVFIFAYGLTDHISAELALGVPYTHKLYGAGAIAGTGQLGTVEVLPPSLFIQYRFFQPEAMLRPFVGVGATYVYFQKETGSGQLTALLNTGGPATTFEIKSKAAPSLQAGLAFNINPKWFVDLTVVKTFLEIEPKFSTGQTQKIKLDPLAVVVAVGYKF
ncbi:OmpW/AlkL family protein [Massilia sp. TWR1-2-2]|uniref:OmpW/AlkL family protein n=1 Tax=Massilia sp. TWR1-2-2 TaxID=2804584 RepID=UPI003CF8B093